MVTTSNGSRIKAKKIIYENLERKYCGCRYLQHKLTFVEYYCGCRHLFKKNWGISVRERKNSYF